MLRPLRDHAVVRIEHNEALGKTGLIWFSPRRYAGDPGRGGYGILRATVEAIGPGKPITKGERRGERTPMDLRVGDVVWIGRFAGLDLEDREDVRLIRQNEAMLIEET